MERELLITIKITCSQDLDKKKKFFFNAQCTSEATKHKVDEVILIG